MIFQPANDGGQLDRPPLEDREADVRTSGRLISGGRHGFVEVLVVRDRPLAPFGEMSKWRSAYFMMVAKTGAEAEPPYIAVGWLRTMMAVSWGF